MARPLVVLPFAQRKFYAPPVNDIAALAAITAANRRDQQQRYVETEGSIFFFDNESNAGDNDGPPPITTDTDGVVLPNDDPATGRWLKIQGNAQDHGQLIGLNDSDDHNTLYVHLSINRTITANHTFAPASSGAPFTLGPNASGQLVGGLNADLLDGREGSDYTLIAGTRAFTGAVSGVTPTVNAHLTTKLYVDTEVAAASGEIVKDHGGLTGLGDDDHIQYILVDGTRAFTGAVSGITPTLDPHLATKSYVDGEVAAASGEIIKDHGNLSGLSDDDHTQYVLATGLRAFTGAVSGIDPTLDPHLATKFYVDTEITSATTGMGNVTGSGTTNFITKWLDPSGNLVDSQVFDNGSFVGIGTVAASGSELFNVAGNVFIDGKLTVTGALDPTSLLLSGGTALFIESNDGSTAPLSSAGTGRQRYLAASGEWQVSTEGGPYRNLVTTVPGAEVDTNAFHQGGDAFGALAQIGTIDGNDLAVVASGVEVARFNVTSGTFSASGQIQSLISTGTPPFSVNSVTLVTGLNSDLLDGRNADEFALLAGVGSGQTLHGGTFPGGTLTLRGNDEDDGDVILNDLGGNVLIGTIAASGSALLTVQGNTFIDGKLTVTGAIDPTSVLLSGGTALFFESNNGSTAPVSASGTGRLRYISASGWQVSSEGGVYENIVTGLGVTTFTSLTDTPANYTSASGKFVTIKGDETGIEFTDPAGGDPFGQYFLLAGRSPAQVANFGTTASASGIIRATSNVTPGTLALNDLGGNIQIGATPDVATNVNVRVDQNTTTLVRVENLIDDTASRAGFAMTCGATGNAGSLSITAPLFTSLANSADAFILQAQSDLTGGIIFHTNGSAPIIARVNGTEVWRTIGGATLFGRESVNLSGSVIEAELSNPAGSARITVYNPAGDGVTQFVVASDTGRARFGGMSSRGPTLADAIGLKANELAFGTLSSAMGAVVIHTISANPVRCVTNQIERWQTLSTGEFVLGTPAASGSALLTVAGGGYFDNDLTVRTDIIPAASGTGSVGTTSNRWADGFFDTMTTGDFNMQSADGDWKLKEQDDYIMAINNRTGKKYKVSLTEITNSKNDHGLI